MFAKRTGRGLSPAAQEGQRRPPSLGWGVSASTHGPAFLRRGAEPTSSVLATHTKEKKRQRKERKKEEETLAATKVFKQESARAKQLCGSEESRENRQQQRNRGTRSSPLNRWLFEPNAARYHISKNNGHLLFTTTEPNTQQ